MSNPSEAQQLQKQRSRLVAFNQAALQITLSLDPDTVLRDIVNSARSLANARCAVVGVFEASGKLRQFITSGIGPEEPRLMDGLPPELGLLGCLSEIREPLRLSDLTRHARSLGFPPGHPPINSLLAAPIRHLGPPVGNIYLTEKEGGEFSEEDEQVLIMFASQAAIAIDNALRHREAQRARDRFETERRRLEALVESSPVGVLVVDAATRTFASVNQEAERILGMSPESGSTLVRYHEIAIYRRTDGKMYESHERPLARALDRGEVVRAEEILIHLPNGQTVTTLVNATPIYSDDGKIISAVAVVQDMTPLEETQRLRNEFLAMVSHELRTPLTTIKGCTSMVLGSADPLDISEVLQYFRMIDQQSDHLRGLINNLLDMTRIEAGALSVTPKPTDVKTLIDDAKTAFLRHGARNAIELKIAPDLPLIAADGRRIAQVLHNLLSNASKYSPDFSTIRVTGSRDGIFVAISISDEGRGIPSDQLTTMFGKFARIDAGNRGLKIAGEGLGLAICKGIVEAHGGRIWAQSEGEQRGARITFTMPEAADATRDASVPSSLAAPGDQYRILAVDDEPQVLWLLRNILSPQGYRLFGAGNPDEMMNVLEKEIPHLVLLDLMLPGVSGFELMGRIRKVSDAPIIFLSANDQQENIVKALSMGAADYMIKPFSSTELLARVASSLRKRTAADTTVPPQPYNLGNLTIDYANRSVVISSHPVRLSPTEYKLLFELSVNAGRVLTREQILKRIWGSEYSGDGALLRAVVKNLRRKLKDDANNPQFIFTEPRVGYRMANEQQPAPVGP